MGYSCKIIADSIAPNGKRLTTFEITFPRIVLAEINTHRQFSRNSASSRAIPIEKMIDRVKNDPFIPISFGRNQKGMQAEQELTEQEQSAAVRHWLIARDEAVNRAKDLLKIGVHKQITNRLLEPFLWHTAIVSATEYSNFFAQRCHPDAQPEIRRIAEMMQSSYCEDNPFNQVTLGYWHTPYITNEEQFELSADVKRKVSVARCARVSYLSQDGKRDIDKDLELYDRLCEGMHFSPFEHVAQTAAKADWQSGNFFGWKQLRKELPHECR